MRHKTITLCLNSFEIASKKANFSGWVRKKLLQEQENAVDRVEKPPMYEAICEPCDIVYANKLSFMVEHQFCTKCHQKCVYLGASQ